MLGWHHSGFNVYYGPQIWPDNACTMEELSRFVVRTCFSQERTRYLPAKDTMDGQARVTYTARDGRCSKIFGALDWLAQLVTHIPNSKLHSI